MSETPKPEKMAKGDLTPDPERGKSDSSRPQEQKNFVRNPREKSD